jgi:hypothetical protein
MVKTPLPISTDGFFEEYTIPIKAPTKTKDVMRINLAYFVRPINLGVIILCIKFAMLFRHKYNIPAVFFIKRFFKIFQQN